MMKMVLGSTLFGILVLSSIAHSQGTASASANTEGAKKSLAEQCAPDLGQAKERVFANPGGKAWSEFETIKKVPKLDGSKGEMTITVKTSSSGSHFVRSTEYGVANARFQANCYDRGGKLTAMHYEMRTAWGWGYEDKRTFSPGNKAGKATTRYFDLTNNQEIKRPEEAGEISEFTKPAVYQTFDSLPIAGALKKKANATQK